jgi:hypothetical protein
MITLVALLLTAGFTTAQNVSVNTETMPNIDFSAYKTYAWASQVDSKLDPGLYFLNDLQLKERIRGAVGYAMDGRGYKLTRQSPDLVINFRVFDKPANIQTYSEYGSSYFTPGEVESLQDPKRVTLEAGSLIINMIDRKTGKTVWFGTASGLTNSDGFDRRENRVRQAVNLIFKQFNYRGDKY